MGPGSSSISDSIHGGRTGIPMITTDTGITAIRTVTTRAITTQALTKAESITVRTATAMSTPTQPLRPRRNDSRARVIIVEKSTVSLALRRDVRLRAFKAATACGLMGI